MGCARYPGRLELSEGAREFLQRKRRYTWASEDDKELSRPKE